MKVEKTLDGRIVIDFALDEADRLATAILQHAEDLPSTAIDVANLLRAAGYNAKNSFRQPPDPWEPTDEPPPSIGR